MKIGQFLSFGIGGADKASYGLTKGLKELGANVVIFYNKQSFPWPGYLSRFEQVKALGLPMFQVDVISDLNNFELDVLNTHRSGDDSWFVPGFEQIPFNFKVVETNINGYLSTKCDFRIFPSNTMIAGKNITMPHKVIPNPIINKLNDNNLREELGLEDKFIFGRLTRPELFSPTALKAFKTFNVENMHFIYVAPDDNARNLLAKMKNVTVIEQTLDEEYLNKLYNTFDVFCHCNPVGETFGNTVAEAMTHGKPIVSHFGSNSWPQAQVELLGDYKHYVCKDNINSYANLMTQLYRDREEYERYSNYVKARAEELFDYRKVSKQYLEVYKSLL